MDFAWLMNSQSEQPCQVESVYASQLLSLFLSVCQALEIRLFQSKSQMSIGEELTLQIK